VATPLFGAGKKDLGRLTPFRGNAVPYESESAALYKGFSLRESRQIGEFRVERIINPRKRFLTDNRGVPA
jgi:hypothetical protein